MKNINEPLTPSEIATGWTLLEYLTSVIGGVDGIWLRNGQDMAYFVLALQTPGGEALLRNRPEPCTSRGRPVRFSHCYPNDEPLAQGALIRIARKEVLGWNRKALDEYAKVPNHTVQKVENDYSGHHKELIATLRAALERAGVRFEPGAVCWSPVLAEPDATPDPADPL